MPSNILTNIAQCDTTSIVQPPINQGEIKRIIFAYGEPHFLIMGDSLPSDAFLVSMRFNSIVFAGAPLLLNIFSSIILSIDDSPGINVKNVLPNSGTVRAIDGYINHANAPFSSDVVLPPFDYNGNIKIIKPTSEISLWVKSNEGAPVDMSAKYLRMNITLTYIKI